MENALDFFDHIYIINLDRRTDRWDTVSQELRKTGIADRTERISGIDNGNAKLGCTLSHLKALEKAIHDEALRPLILEDDVHFFDGWDDTLKKAIHLLPEDWDLFYLGYNFDPAATGDPATFVNPNFLHIHYCLAAHAYSVNQKSLMKIRDELAGKMSAETPPDAIYASVAKRYRYYGIYPMIAGQSKSYSDIQGAVVTYTLRENVDGVLKNHGKI